MLHICQTRVGPWVESTHAPVNSLAKLVRVSRDIANGDLTRRTEIRTRDDQGAIQIEKSAPSEKSRLDSKETKTPRRRRTTATPAPEAPVPLAATARFEPARGALQTVRIYPYGVARNRLMQAAKRLGVPAVVVRDVSEADALVTLRTYYRNRQQTVIEAEQRGLPIYVLRANTVAQGGTVPQRLVQSERPNPARYHGRYPQ